MIRTLFPLTPILVAALLHPAATGRADDALAKPSDTVRRLLEAIRQSKHPDPAQAAAARKEANLAMDITSLCRKSLATQWDGLNEEGRAQFVNLLTRIFEVRAYPKSAEFFQDLSVQFGEESVKDSVAVVRTTVMHPEEGRVDIDYRLTQTPAGWIVSEVTMDGVPMGANLRNQIRKVLTKDGYDELLKQLQEKLKEFEAESAAAGSGK
jgi:phospholipid transport system substrate-binding protein